jgi:hypothetical protein
MDQLRYGKLVLQAAKLVERKGEDYNKGAALEDYFPFGDKSYVQMIYVKAMRLRSLSEVSGPPNFDSAKDTVLDLINYCVFYLDYLEKQHG